MVRLLGEFTYDFQLVNLCINHSLPATVQLSLLHLVDFLLGFVLWFARMFKRKGEKEREKLGDRKTCQKGELQLTYITTIGKNRLQK